MKRVKQFLMATGLCVLAALAAKAQDPAVTGISLSPGALGLNKTGVIEFDVLNGSSTPFSCNNQVIWTLNIPPSVIIDSTNFPSIPVFTFDEPTWSNFVEVLVVQPYSSVDGTILLVQSKPGTGGCPYVAFPGGTSPAGAMVFTLHVKGKSLKGTAVVSVGASSDPAVGTNDPSNDDADAPYSVTPVISPAGPFCINAGPTQLSATPSGGFYSGDGVSSSGVFTPANAGAGSHTISYSYNNGGEVITTSTQITVNALPTVSIAPAGPFCISASATQLSGSPTGGTFSGPGVSSSGVFTPANAGAGSKMITYSYTDGNGCTNSASTNIIVNDLPTVSAGTYAPVCANAGPVALMGTPSGGTFSGTGVSGNSFDPAAGTQTITYFYTDGNGCSNSATTTITVNPTLPVSVTIVSNDNDNIICAGTSVTFTATATNGGSSPAYQWQLNGNDVQNETGNTFTTTTLSNNDAVRVVLTSNATPCATGSPATSNAISTTVRPNPTLSGVTASASSVCAGTAVGFSASGLINGSTIFNYSVAGPNGTQTGSTTTTVSNGMASFPAASYPAGMYTFTITSATVNGCTTSFSSNNSTSFEVNSIPTATISGTTAVCQGATSPLVTFTGNNGIAPYTFTYKIGNGNPTTIATTSGSTATISVSTTTPGSYTYTLLSVQDASASQCSQSQSGSATITVNPNLPVSVTIVSSDNDDIICAGTSITFTATATNGGSSPAYQWQVNGNNVQNASGNTFTTTTLSNNDAVRVVLTSDVSPCATDNPATSNTIITTVRPNPTISSVAPSAASVCEGAAVSFTANGLIDGQTTFNYTVNGTPGSETVTVSGGTTTFSAGTPAPGTYNIKIVSATVNGCTTTFTTNNETSFTVNPNLPVSVTISSDDADNTICAGTGVTFTATPVNGGNTPAYQWRINGNNITGQTAATFTTSMLNNGDMVSVVLTSSASPCATGNPATSSPITITVRPNPTLGGVAPSASSVCNGTAVNFTASGLIDGTTTFNYTINSASTTTTVVVSGGTTTFSLGTPDAGTYNIKLVSATVNGCTTTFNTNNETSITIKPNPTISSVAPSAASVCEGTAVSFTANGLINGSTIFNYTINGTPSSETVTVSGGTTTFSAGMPAPGTYNIKIVSATVDGCTTTFTTNNETSFTVNPNLPVSVDIVSSDADNTICTGTPVTFTATPMNGGNTPVYQWRINSSNVQNAINSSFTTSMLNNGDVVSVVLTSSASPCATGNPATSNAITTTVNALPIVNAGSYAPVCSNAGAVSLTGTPSGGTFSGTGVTGSSFNPAAGTQTITYSFTNANGCTNTATSTITVYAAPAVSINAAGPYTVNAPAVQLAASPSGGTFSGNGVSASGLFTPGNAGVGSHPVTYTYTNSNSCTSSATTTIVVTALVDLTPSITMTLNNFNPGASRNLIVNLQELSGTNTSSGTVAFSVTVPNGYSIVFDNSLTSITPAGGANTPTSNPNWNLVSTQSGGRKLNFMAKSGVFIAGNGKAVIGFTVTRQSAVSGSAVQMNVNIADDTSGSYDSNAANNIINKILSAN